MQDWNLDRPFCISECHVYLALVTYRAYINIEYSAVSVRFSVALLYFAASLCSNCTFKHSSRLHPWLALYWHSSSSVCGLLWSRRIGPSLSVVGSLGIHGLNSTADRQTGLYADSLQTSACVRLSTFLRVIKMEILFAGTVCRRAANLISPAICRAVSAGRSNYFSARMRHGATAANWPSLRFGESRRGRILRCHCKQIVRR